MLTGKEKVGDMHDDLSPCSGSGTREYLVAGTDGRVCANMFCARCSCTYRTAPLSIDQIMLPRCEPLLLNPVKFTAGVVQMSVAVGLNQLAILWYL